MPLTEIRDLLLGGDAAGALARLNPLVARHPGEPECRYWLASALAALGAREAASEAMSNAITLHALTAAREMNADLAAAQSDGAYANRVATTLYGNNCVAMASVFWGMAISADHVDANTLVSYGLSLQHQGRIEEAIQVFRAAAETFPSPGVGQFLLFPHVFADGGDRRFADEARAWSKRYAPSGPPPRFANPPSAGRKLRIGYVAPDFSGSQLRQFVAPLFENHDPDAVEVFLYPADAATEAGWPAWVKVHAIGKLNDAQAVRLIRSHRIDVLNDLWGHTAGSRLPVFALRAAPVQAGWINFAQTTGLDEMDYVLHATSEGLPHARRDYTEKVWPIGPAFTAFRPAACRAEPTPTPALREGRVTFGSFNHPSKLSDGCAAAWAAAMRRTPGSRLLLKYRYYADAVLRRTTQARFAAHGIAPERIAFQGHSAGAEYLAAFGEMDLALDAWPAPGSTTTLEALSNGVPVLVLAGPELTLGGLYARSIVQAAGLDELVATDPDDFVEKAVALAADPQALDALRARVRPGFDAGPCCDEAGFTRRLEDEYRAMFDAWAARSRSASAA